MENVPPFIWITGILSLLLQLLTFLGIKVNLKDLKKYITIHKTPFTWNIYLIIATLLTIYFFYVISIVISNISSPFYIATFMVLILWGLLGTWSPAIRRLNNRCTNIFVEIISLLLVTLVVLGFWKVKWPEIQPSIFVTLLYLAFMVCYVITKIVNKKKIKKFASHIN
jgi:hypothetical protein